MAANEKNEPITFGAVVDRSASPTQPQPVLRPSPSTDSAMSSTTAEVAAKKEWAADPTNPYSAFYKHPEARRSLDVSAPQSKTHLDINTYERDAEACHPLSAATTQQQSKVSVDGRVKECTMWPTRQTVMNNRKMDKRTRGCAFFHNMNRKQRLWAKIAIALVIIAAAVGLGVGISRAVGGGVWAGQGKNKEIPQN